MKHISPINVYNRRSSDCRNENIDKFDFSNKAEFEF